MSPVAKKTKVRKVEEERPIFRDDDPVQTEDEDDSEPSSTSQLHADIKAQPKKPLLSLDGPFSTARHQLDMLTKTKDGKLIFQSRQTGTIITTDLDGFDIPRKEGDKQYVFNSTPHDLRMFASRRKFVIGEVIYVLKPQSRVRKVFAGRVTAMDSTGVVVDVLGAIGNAKFSKTRTRPDGSILCAYNTCFRDRDAVEAYITQFRDDLTKSMTDYRHLLEQTRR